MEELVTMKELESFNTHLFVTKPKTEADTLELIREFRRETAYLQSIFDQVGKECEEQLKK